MLTRIAAPAALAIDRETVWSHLRTISADSSGPAPEDADYIDMLIEAAVDRLDGPTGLLNRALITQQWAATFDRFAPEMVIPLARCRSITSMKYLDRSGTEIDLAQSAYRATGIGSDRCVLRTATGSWPAALGEVEAVTVTFTCGFGDTPADVPASIRHALLEAVARAYAFREDVIAGASFSALPGSAGTAVTDWRVWHA